MFNQGLGLSKSLVKTCHKRGISEMASLDEFSWKDEVRATLLAMLDNDQETLSTILSYLDEDNNYHDGNLEAWALLHSAIDSDGLFKEFVTSIATKARNVLPEKASTSWNDFEAEDYSWKDEIRERLMEMFKNDPDALRKILEHLDENTDASQNDVDDNLCHWTALHSAMNSEEDFKECAERLVKDMTKAERNEDTCESMDHPYGMRRTSKTPTDSSANCSWKDDIRTKLVAVFENDFESFLSISLYLEDEDEKYDQNDSEIVSPAWSILRSAQHSDRTFQEYAQRIAEDTKKADKDKCFRESMDIVYSQMMEPMWIPEDNALDTSWKDDIRSKLIEMFKHDEDTLQSILSDLDAEDEACAQNGASGISPTWNILRDAFCGVPCRPDMNPEDAERYMEAMEVLLDAERDFAWKSTIRSKLLNVLENDPYGMSRILTYLEEEEKMFQNDESASSQPVWNVLKSVFDSDKFEYYAQCLVEDTWQADVDPEYRESMNLRYTQMLESLQSVEGTASFDDDPCKEAIISKLVSTLGEDPGSVANILFYLGEEEKAYKDSSAGLRAPCLELLKSTMYSDEVFRHYAEWMAEDIKMAEKDAPHLGTMSIIYSRMLKPLEELVPASHAQMFQLKIPKPSITDLVSKQTGDFLQSVAKNPRAITALGVLFKPPWSYLFAGVAVTAFLGYKAYKSVSRWRNGEISGKRCSKEMIDSIGSMAAGAAGGLAGGLATSLIGGVVGSAAGTMLAAWAMGRLCDRLTQWLFGIPADEALENAYIFLGVDMTASNNEVNKAYRKLCLEHHPDKTGGDSENFVRLQCSIEIVRNARAGI